MLTQLLILGENMLILGEGAMTLDPSLTAGISAIGSVGFAFWYAYYTTTVAIPKLTANHEEERKLWAANCQAERTAMQERFDRTITSILAEMKEQRDKR